MCDGRLPQFRIEACGAHHDRFGVDSGVAPLDRYVRTRGGQVARTPVTCEMRDTMKDSWSDG